jgi:hypothetical protein
MSDLAIKPTTGSGNKVIIQDQAGGAVLTTADSGATITNATITSPTITSPAGIGLARTDGTLHVHTASAGTVAASSQADDLVIENSVEGGMTILTPDAQSARIRFSSPSTASGDVGGASILYRQNINKMVLGTEVSGGVLGLKSGAGVERMTIDASGRVLIPNQPSMLSQPDSASAVGISNGQKIWGHNTSGGIRHNNGFTLSGGTTVATTIFNGNNTGKITVPSDGRYLLYWDARCESHSSHNSDSGAGQFYCWVNGTQRIRRHIAAWAYHDYTHENVCACLTLSANDYIEIGAWWNSASNQGSNFSGTGDTVNWFYLAKIS